MRSIIGHKSKNRALEDGARATSPHQNPMPIHAGIMCERCRKIHFIATSSGIQLSRSGGAGGGMYRLNCPPPCAEMKEFRKEGMRPYRVADEVFRRGYASEGEYELVDERTTRRGTPQDK